MTGEATGRSTAVALLGLRGRLVEIEAALTNQKPGFRLVGLPDAALREAQVRVRSAVEHSGFQMPRRHLTVNLSPAALPKHGSAFDLGIAVAILATEGVIQPTEVGDTVHIGELALDGRLRPVPGVLPAVLAARRDGRTTVVVPTANRTEAELVSGIRVVGVPSLRELAIFHGADLQSVPVEPVAPATVHRTEFPIPDLADVVGADDAVQALIVAAAGGHHMLMVGPPGAGKTMLATRLPGLLPDLDEEEALDAGCVRSLLGDPRVGVLDRRPPWSAPHHGATQAAIIGGGSGVLRPGEAVRASGGVLFLDEAPEFAVTVLDALRQPLESGRITIERASATAEFPGRFQLVLAANPCPCGHWGTREGTCTCPPERRRRYLRRLSGPLMDRIDIQLRLDRVTAVQLRTAEERATITTADARQRVLAARARADARLVGTPWRRNVDVPGSWLRAPERRLDRSTRAVLDRALEVGRLTMRGYDRVLRVAWTLADLDGVDRPSRAHVGQALTFREDPPMTVVDALDDVEEPHGEPVLLDLDPREVHRAVAGVRPGADGDSAAVHDAFARAAWSCIAEAGDGAAGALVSALGSTEALRRLVRGGALSQSPDTAAGLESAAARWRPRLESAAVFRALRNAAQLGATLALPDDEHWPPGLSDLGPHAPLALWVLAPKRRLPVLGRAIALVGARAATRYGEGVAMEAAAGLADRDFAVVSGAAYGIDGAAHHATLASGGTTVAVLAGGVDQFYPSGHVDLIRRIARTGAVIAESPCGTRPLRSRFLQRNRLIAAMTGATVVIEAGSRSGSLNTAAHAAALGRPVGAVPGSVHSAASAGCHRLLREFGAVCVCDPAEMAELVDGVQDQPMLDGLGGVDPLEQRVLEVLGATPRTTLELARRASLSEREVAGAVGALALTGAADKVPAGWTRARRRR